MSREAKQNKPINQMTKYKFVTIVAPENVRAEFTEIRKQLKTTDKQLMQAMFNLATADMGALAHELDGLKELALNLKQITNISKGEAPGVTSKAAKTKQVLAKKEPKPKKEKPAPKAKKEKAPKKTIKFEGCDEPEMFVGEGDDDFQPLIVNGL